MELFKNGGELFESFIKRCKEHGIEKLLKLPKPDKSFKPKAYVTLDNSGNLKTMTSAINYLDFRTGQYKHIYRELLILYMIMHLLTFH
jgi:hypothetical protein